MLAAATGWINGHMDIIKALQEIETITGNCFLSTFNKSNTYLINIIHIKLSIAFIKRG